MKKLLVSLLIVITFTSSCATIAGGKVTTYQRTKPKAGEPQRQVKLGALICDVVFWGGAGLIVDFATGAIYKPAPTEKK
jgi:hypothetical protein